jgi:hypothetical protein
MIIKANATDAKITASNTEKSFRRVECCKGIRADAIVQPGINKNPATRGIMELTARLAFQNNTISTASLTPELKRC